MSTIVETPPPWVQAATNTMLFALISFLAASIDFKIFPHDKQGIKRLLSSLLTTCGCQFVLQPLIGFISITIFSPEAIAGIILLVITASPGGAGSNWYCNVFNADLALSVSATALSTVLSIGMLPLNLFLYLSAAYDPTALEHVSWPNLLTTVAVVCAAVIGGLFTSRRVSRRPQAALIHARFGKAGNLVGLLLVVGGAALIFVRGGFDIADKPPSFYGACVVITPTALVVATIIASLPFLHLSGPQRTAIGVEVAFQNSGIALSLAVNAFPASDAATAAAAVLIYVTCQLCTIPLYLVVCWQCGWTYAPRHEPILKVLLQSYQPQTAEGQPLPTVAPAIGNESVIDSGAAATEAKGTDGKGQGGGGSLAEEQASRQVL